MNHNRMAIFCIVRGRSFLSPDTQLECFLRGTKFLAKNLRGLKITRKIIRGLKILPSVKNKGCDTIRGAKLSCVRENKGEGSKKW